MQTIKEMIQQIQAITYGAYKASGQAAALLGETSTPSEAMAKALERTAAQMEQDTVELRALCESCLPELLTIGRKPVLPTLDVAGSISVNEFGWLLIELNTLLPHCRFSTPVWLTDTIARLLDRHERSRGSCPYWTGRCWSSRSSATWIPGMYSTRIIKGGRPSAMPSRAGWWRTTISSPSACVCSPSGFPGQRRATSMCSLSARPGTFSPCAPTAIPFPADLWLRWRRKSCPHLRLQTAVKTPDHRLHRRYKSMSDHWLHCPPWM